jgi:hypothetical protein
LLLKECEKGLPLFIDLGLKSFNLKGFRKEPSGQNKEGSISLQVLVK